MGSGGSFAVSSTRVRIGVAGIAILAATLVAGCGGGTTTTVTESPAETTSSTAGTSAAAPSGDLAADRVGPVVQGTSPQETIGLFGPPDRKDRFAGCELDPKSPELVQLTYDLPDGSLSIAFDAATGGMLSYTTTSPQFPTTSGDRVGDSFAGVQQNWGDALDPLDLGVPSTERSGTWYVREGPRAELLFAIHGGTVKTISGGYLPPCE